MITDAKFQVVLVQTNDGKHTVFSDRNGLELIMFELEKLGRQPKKTLVTIRCTRDLENVLGYEVDDFAFEVHERLAMRYSK